MGRATKEKIVFLQHLGREFAVSGQSLVENAEFYEVLTPCRKFGA
jgi:hypothetical protein